MQQITISHYGVIATTIMVPDAFALIIRANPMTDMSQPAPIDAPDDEGYLAPDFDPKDWQQVL